MCAVWYFTVASRSPLCMANASAVHFVDMGIGFNTRPFSHPFYLERIQAFLSFKIIIDFQHEANETQYLHLCLNFSFRIQVHFCRIVFIRAKIDQKPSNSQMKMKREFLCCFVSLNR